MGRSKIIDEARERVKNKDKEELRSEVDLGLKGTLIDKDREYQQQLKKEILLEKYGAKAPKYWAAVLDQAKKLKRSGMEGYADWGQGMMDIALSSVLLGKAMHAQHAAIVSALISGATGMLAKGVSATVEKLGRLAGVKIKNAGNFLKCDGIAVKKFSDLLDLTGEHINADQPVGVVTYKISVDARGRVSVNGFLDGKSFEQIDQENGTTDLQEEFDPGWVTWLAVNDLEMDEDCEVTDERTGIKLNREELQERVAELEKDPNTSLQAFLEGRYQMKMQAKAEEEPARGPR